MRKRPVDRLRLLHGPYQAPGLRVGDRTTCLYRDCDVIVASWTDAPISWPRCKRATGKGHPSLLVDAELIRAIRSEGAATVGTGGVPAPMSTADGGWVSGSGWTIRGRAT